LKYQYLLFCAIAWFGSNHAIAQKEFAPEGAEWCYQYLNSDNDIEAYIGMKFIKDTFADPWEAKLIRGKLVNISSMESLDRYNRDYLYHTSNDSVSFIYGNDSPLFYLFDTRYRIGDTVLTYLYNSSFLVTEVDSITFKNENIHISDMELILNRDISIRLYGHIGPNTGFLEGWWTNPLDDNIFELAAYRDDEIGTISIKEEACFSILEYVAPEKLKPDTCQLIVFPNPVQDPLQLKLECNNNKTRTFDLVIRDVAGRLCLREQITFVEMHEVDVSKFSSGEYFGTLQNENKRFDFKFSKFQ